MLCTVDDQPLFLSEIRRVLGPEARFGFVVYCASHEGDLALPVPEGNDFPTPEALDRLLEDASLRVLDSGWTDHFAAFPGSWEDAMGLVQTELEERHGNDPRWHRAEEQSDRMGALLEKGEVRGRLLVVGPA